MENMKYMAFSRYWARLLAQQNNLSEEKEMVLAYAIEMLVINLDILRVGLIPVHLYAVRQLRF